MALSSIACTRGSPAATNFTRLQRISKCRIQSDSKDDVIGTCVCRFPAGGSLARLTRSGHAQQYLKQQQPALEVYGDKEVLLGMFAAVLPQLRGELRVREQVTDLIRASFN